MIYFTGDINLTDWDFNPGFGIGSRIEKGFNPFAHLERNDADLWIGNFEGVASKTTTSTGLASKVFRVDPDALRLLPHFNVYGFANNHAMQHGAEAYENTIKSLESVGSLVFGTKERKSIALCHKGKKFTLTGMCLRIDEFSDNPSYWYNPEYKEIEEEVASLPSDAFKVLYVHWGNEYINRPSSQQKKFAHWLIDAGFDLIIGMHPHVLQGYEDYKGKRIYYSLGNFVFDTASEPCKYGAIVGLDLTSDEPVYTEQYVKIEDCSPRLIDKADVPVQYTIEHLNECLKKEDNSEGYHAEISRGYTAYRKENHKQILKDMVRHPGMAVGLIKDFIQRRF